MIRKIHAYGSPVLSQEGDWIEEGHENLSELVQDMYDTMESARGIGLAAQQIGLPLKIFVLDLPPMREGEEGGKKVYINSEIIEESEDMISMDEGCLSFPGMSVNVSRHKRIKVYYEDENFKPHEEWLEGIHSIAFQHEHDHTEGITFLKYATPLKKQLLSNKLKQLRKGNVQPLYPMKFS